ncbi:MAG TPA: hypothetical protein V6C86_02495 [Oculatellaceae cyanobacterium]
MSSAQTVHLIHLVVLSMLFLQMQPACADSHDFDLLAKRIMHIELEMQKINCHLHLEAANPSFWRMRRTWLWDTSNALATEGGLVAATALFYDHDEDRYGLKRSIKVDSGRLAVSSSEQHYHNRVSGSSIAGDLYPQIVGQAVGGVGSLFELGTDCARAIRLRKRNLNRNAVTAKMCELDKQANDLLRQITLAADCDQNAGIEVQLLKDVKQECLQEFVRLEGQAGNISIGRWIEDGISVTRNTVGLVGNSINASGVLRNSRIINGDGTILNLISASLITIRPFISNGGTYLANRENKRHTRQYFPELYENTATPALDSEFQQLMTEDTNDDSLKFRKMFYKEQLAKINDDRDLAKEQKTRLKQRAARRYRESFYGPTKQAQSILGLLASFGGGNNTTAMNRISAAGNTTYMTGQAFNIMELMRERVVDENGHNQLKKENMLPEQRLQRKLVQLDTMERRIAAP